MTTHPASTLVVGVGCVLAAFLGRPAPAAGQVAVFPVQGLGFGVLQPGLSETVTSEDAARRAEIEIRGTGNFNVTLQLPTFMESADGDRLPLSFAQGDGQVQFLGSGRTRKFDPTRPTTLNVPRREGGALLLVGGDALPTTNQPPGAYTATIQVQVVAPGT